MLYLAGILTVVGWILIVLPLIPNISPRVFWNGQLFILVGAILNFAALAIALPIALQAR